MITVSREEVEEWSRIKTSNVVGNYGTEFCLTVHFWTEAKVNVAVLLSTKEKSLSLFHHVMIKILLYFTF